MDKFFLLPPFAFAIILTVAVLFGQTILRLLSYKRGTKNASDNSPYACGEEEVKHLIQPDYSQFFPFAFFFAILHIIALMATTVPVETLDSFTITIFYLLGAIVSLFVFLRGVRRK